MTQQSTVTKEKRIRMGKEGKYTCHVCVLFSLSPNSFRFCLTHCSFPFLHYLPFLHYSLLLFLLTIFFFFFFIKFSLILHSNSPNPSSLLANCYFTQSRFVSFRFPLIPSPPPPPTPKTLYPKSLPVNEFGSFLMAHTLHKPLSFTLLFILYFTFAFASHSHHDFSILDSDFDSFYSDYSPPSPPPPPPLPHPPSLSCQEGLNGTGSLNTTCNLNSSLVFASDVCIEGNGSLNILAGVNLSCPVMGCVILINMSREFSLQNGAMIIAGTVVVASQNASLLGGSVINVTGLAGAPPAQTSGTPSGTQGAGGGHGGRGATCVSDNTKLPDDVWGGDAYSWSSLDEPWSYGSKGGTTSKEDKYGGEGGGIIRLVITDSIEVSGDLLANGGDGGIKGGGGSGGSIYVEAHRM